MTVLAHAADYISLAFFVPVIAFIGWLALTQYRERRAERDGAGEPEPDG